MVQKSPRRHLWSEKHKPWTIVRLKVTTRVQDLMHECPRKNSMKL